MRVFIVILAACAAGTVPAAPPPVIAHEPPSAGFEVHSKLIPGGVRAIATDGAVVAALSYDDVLYGLTDRGVRLFRRRLVIPGASSLELSVIGDVLVVTSSEAVLGLATATGKVRWRRSVEGNDTLSTRIAGDQVWIDGDGASYTVAARTGTEVVRRAPVHARTIDVTHADDRIRLAASEHGRELWHTEHARPFAMTASYVELGDTIVFPRGNAPGSTVVAVDAATGRERWTLDVDADHFFRYAYRGAGLFWLVLDDAAAMRDGSIGYRWLAVTDAGKVIDQLDTPTSQAIHCGGNVNWDSAGGVLAVSHPSATADGCGQETLDLLVPPH